jgi:hypothetical protein
MTKKTPNQRLRELIAETGVTYATIAGDVRAIGAANGDDLRTNKSTVEHWISGTRPAGKTGQHLAAALSHRLGRIVTEHDLGWAPPEGHRDDTIGVFLHVDPFDALQPLWRGEVDRRSFLNASAYSVAAAALPLEHVRDIAARTTAAARTGLTAGMAEVSAVRDMVTAFTVMDERHGGQHGRTALIQYLRDDLSALCRGRFRTDEVRQQMLSAAARAVHLAGWKAYDAGQQGLAQQYYLWSYRLAVESEVTGQDGFVLRTMAMQGLKLNRPEHCQGLAETGLNRAKGKVDPAAEALFRITYANTLAKGGQRRRAIEETQLAHDLLTRGHEEELPFWALAWGPPQGTVLSRSAKVFQALGDPRNAAAQYAQAAAARPAATYARIIALDLVAEAELHLAQGGIEYACATWGRAMDHMDGVVSARTRKAVTRMRRDLSRFRARGVRCAQQLDERAVEFLRA